MTHEFDAKYAQMEKDAVCPEGFVDWLKKQKLVNIESLGRAAPTEERLTTESPLSPCGRRQVQDHRR